MRQYPTLSGRWQVWLTSRAARPRAWAEDHALIITVGLATCFFGFLAGALANLYLIATHHPLAFMFRTTLSYRSAIFGDGLALPLVNMAVASFLSRERQHVGRARVVAASLVGMTITAWFHVVQAENQLVNWSMPAPWQWNGLGVWHAGYMLAVTTLLALFVLVLFEVVRSDFNQRDSSGRAAATAIFPLEVVVVVAGLLVFLVLLHLDYRAATLEWVLPLP